MYFIHISNLLKKMDAVRIDILQKYLIARVGISETAARQTVYASIRNRTCYASDDEQYALRVKDVVIDRAIENRNIALSYILRYLPESDVFTPAEPPWTLVFTMSGVLIQIAVIEIDTEVANSLYICSRPVPEDERGFLRRVAIVKRPAGASMLKAAGFTHIIGVNSHWEMELLRKISFDQAWEDVPCR